MRAYSHQGHGPRADQTGRIHISDFRNPRTISIAKRSRSIHKGHCRRFRPESEMPYFRGASCLLKPQVCASMVAFGPFFPRGQNFLGLALFLSTGFHRYDLQGTDALAHLEGFLDRHEHRDADSSTCG